MKVTLEGYVCDVCDKFHEERVGWYVLRPIDGSEDDEVEVCCPSCIGKLSRELSRAAEMEPPKRPNQFTGMKWTKEEHEQRHQFPSQRTRNCDWCVQEYGTTQTANPNSVHSPGRKSKNSNGSGPGGTVSNDEPCWWCDTVFDTRQGLYMHMNRAHGLMKDMDDETVARSINVFKSVRGGFDAETTAPVS